MAAGKRPRDRQPAIWVPTAELPTSAGHPFYARLNQLLRDRGCDDFAEARYASFYAATMGRPGLAPGRLLLVGYFEGLDSERAIAWRAADSLTLRDFLGRTFSDAPPDQSTISRTRRRIDVETHQDMFTWVLARLGEPGLVQGHTIAIDATTLEANAALRHIVRRDNGESYEAFLTALAQASGIETPTRTDLARLDRKRKKKGSNQDWTSPADPDARITKMKDGRTHLAHKAEHAVDLDTGAIVAVTMQGADHGDTATLPKTLAEAFEQLDQVTDAEGKPVAVADEVVADRRCHSRAVVFELNINGFRTYISEPDRGPQSWIDQEPARDAVYANRRRIRGDRGKHLLRGRGEHVERSFARVYDSGGMRRTHLRGTTNILKRVLVHASGFNLGLMMRRVIGVGTPRGPQGRLATALPGVIALWRAVLILVWDDGELDRGDERSRPLVTVAAWVSDRWLETGTCTTGRWRGQGPYNRLLGPTRNADRVRARRQTAAKPAQPCGPCKEPVLRRS
jgi:transposase